MARPRKDAAHVRQVRQAAAHKRWDRLSAPERQAALRPAIAASPLTKPGSRRPVGGLSVSDNFTNVDKSW
jgi:hypothetical protein